MIINDHDLKNKQPPQCVFVTLWNYISTERLSPSNHPTIQQSNYSTTQPPNHPTTQTSNNPTFQPPDLPTIQPFNNPTIQPPNYPTLQPSNHPTSHVVQLIFLPFCLLPTPFLLSLFSSTLPIKTSARSRATATRCSNTCAPQEGSKVLPFTIFQACLLSTQDFQGVSSPISWTRCCFVTAPTHNRHTNRHPNRHQHSLKTYKPVSHADKLVTIKSSTKLHVK